MSDGLILYRAPFSTNVERVALALAYKGLTAESVVIDYGDRREVERVSGQPLVPVLVDGDRVVSDSARILEYLEARAPEPPLFPSAAAQRATMDVFIDWFNRVWKAAPNEIEAQLGGPHPAAAGRAELGALIQGRLSLFNDLLQDRDFLFGPSLSAADCIAFPFLKFALVHDPADDEPFHRILDEHQTLGPEHAALARWIERVDALPRA